MPKRSLLMICVFAFLSLVLSACGPGEEQQSEEAADTETMDSSEAMAAEPVAVPELSLAWEVTGLEVPESAVYDRERQMIYVSNIVGNFLEADEVGFISKVSLNGAVVEREWITGLNAPKGLAISGGSLFVSDLNRLAEFEIETGRQLNEWPVENPQFVNDVVVAADGAVYLSDMTTDRIFRLQDGTFELWLQSADLENPNGLYIDDGTLFVAAWGVVTDPETLATDTPGHIKTVTLEGEPTISSFGDGSPLGNLDGIVGDGSGNFFVSDWVAGKVYFVTADGTAHTLLELAQGTADIGLVRDRNMLLVPVMTEGKLMAYTW